jgi:arabinofuranosyltransferase
LLASFIVLTRHDLVLLIGPLVAFYVFRRAPLRIRSVALGLSPFVIWEAFSFFYYGSWVPNTAYAKLGASTPLLGRVAQGLWYLGDFCLHDPVGAGAMLVALVLLVFFGGTKDRFVAGGVASYLAYVVWIGGDFMSGRFLAVPVFTAVAASLAVVSSRAIEVTRLRRHLLAGAAAAVAVIGLFGMYPRSTHEPDSHGVGDARRFWADALSLNALRDGRNVLRIHWVQSAIEARNRAQPMVVIRGSLGLYGYYCGPTVHVIDRFALADPLLSRLPARAGSRIGHFERRMPDGYVESVTTGENVVVDPHLRAYYQEIRMATRSPVLSIDRLRRLVPVSFGFSSGSLENYLERTGSWHREPVEWKPRTSSMTIEYFYAW